MRDGGEGKEEKRWSNLEEEWLSSPCSSWNLKVINSISDASVEGEVRISGKRYRLSSSLDIYICFLTSDIKDCVSFKDEHSHRSLAKGHLDTHTRCYTHLYNVAHQGENTDTVLGVMTVVIKAVYIHVWVGARRLLLLWLLLWWKGAEEEQHE